MKSPSSSHRKSHKNLLIIMTVVLLLIAGGVGAFYFKSTNEETTPIDNSTVLTPPTDEQIEAGNDAKEDTISSPKPGSSSDTPNSNPEAALAVKITAANQNGSTLQVRTLIDSVVSSGTCELKLSKGDITVTKNSDIQPLASSSTCKGFDIDVTDLSTGQWQLTIKYSANGKISSDERTISLI